jgi:hypothetical protein
MQHPHSQRETMPAAHGRGPRGPGRRLPCASLARNPRGIRPPWVLTGSGRAPRRNTRSHASLHPTMRAAARQAAKRAPATPAPHSRAHRPPLPAPPGGPPHTLPAPPRPRRPCPRAPLMGPYPYATHACPARHCLWIPRPWRHNSAWRQCRPAAAGGIAAPQESWRPAEIDQIRLDWIRSG